MKRLLFLIFLLSLIPITYATDINNHEVKILLKKDETAKVEVMLDYEELTTNDIYYFLFTAVEKVKALDSEGELKCSVDYRYGGSQIICTPNKQNKTGYIVNMSFQLRNVRSPRPDFFSFVYDGSITSPTKKMFVEIILPEGYGIVQDTGEFNPYYPQDAFISSTGRNIIISWIKVNPDLGKTYSFSVVYEFISKPLAGIDLRTLIMVLILSITIITLLLYYYRRHSKTEAVLSVLRQSEKQVMDIILENEGKCNQKIILKQTSFSKAKVSRIIADFEQRGLVRKTRKGRNNIIEIVDKTLKKR